MMIVMGKARTTIPNNTTKLPVNCPSVDLKKVSSRFFKFNLQIKTLLANYSLYEWLRRNYKDLATQSTTLDCVSGY